MEYLFFLKPNYLGSIDPPIEWTPPSAWIISPVTTSDKSESKKFTTFATGSGFLVSQPRGALWSHS